MEAHAREQLITRRLRELAALCGALLGGAVLCVALVVVLAARLGRDLAPVKPGTLPFLLALAALLVVLLSSAARAAILRRAVEKEEDRLAEGEEEEEGGEREAVEKVAPGPAPAYTPLAALHHDAQLVDRLTAYERATRVSFALQAAAAGAGLTAALAGDVPFYGLMVCATSAFSMVARWPRRAVVEQFLAGDGGAEARGVR